MRGRKEVVDIWKKIDDVIHTYCIFNSYKADHTSIFFQWVIMMSVMIAKMYA